MMLRDERWKYTDVNRLDTQSFATQYAAGSLDQTVIDSYRLQAGEAILLVLIDGRFAPAHSDLQSLPAEVIARSMDDVEGLFLHVPDNVKISKPLHLLNIASGLSNVMMNPNHLIVLGQAASVTIFQEYVCVKDSVYYNKVLTSVELNKQASLTMIKLQQESQHAIHLENLSVKQCSDSEMSLVNLTMGGTFSRDETTALLKEPGAQCKTSGFYHATSDEQYVDHHIDIYHQAPRTHSEMVYKGILDKKSRAVFNGKLYVEPHAQKISAFQENHNLLLSTQAEVNTKPELEIYADDVKCRHGATIGQIDQDALFYMRARGIDNETARNILLKGFADEILQRITHSAIQQHVRKKVSFS